jgi:hypothetical protein
MFRTSVTVLLVTALVGMGWAVGRAQNRLSDFELTVGVGPDGTTSVTCVRGCRLTWAPTVVPTDRPVEIHVPAQSVNGSVRSQDACVTSVHAPKGAVPNCRIWGFVIP